MWENDRKKAKIKNIILLLLILILSAVLLSAFLYLRGKSEAYDAELSAVQTEQQQQQTAERQETLDLIEAEYEKDLQCVEQYMPGIVCWGDSVTLGASGSTSFTSVLQKYINTYICDIYDFRSTVEDAEDYARLKWDDYKISIPVVNMGAGPETSGTVLGRCGAVPYVTAAALTIPAEAESVAVTLKTPSGKAVNPLTGGNAGINNVVIGGVEGILSIDTSPASGNKNGNSYHFTRLTPGSETPVEAGSEVLTAGGEMYKDYIHIVCIGTYGGYDSPDELVEQVKQLLSRQTNQSERYIVLGTSSDFKLEEESRSRSREKSTETDPDAVDMAMLQAFGNRYISLRRYFCGDGLIDGNVSKTKDDTSAVKQKTIPPSFLVSADGAELNGKANTLLGKLLFNQMEELGYFDEIYEELHISETVSSILKDNPNYFQNMLKYLVK